MPYTPLDAADTRSARLMQSMLDASLHGLLLLTPVYKDGELVDFTVDATNNAIRHQVGFDIDSTRKPLMSEVFPGYKACGYFDAYAESLNRKQVIRRELYYQDDQISGWFDIGVAPDDEWLVVSFVNISRSKRDQQRSEDMAAQLEAIMNVTQAGIFTFLPVYDDRGEVTDFRFGMSNDFFAAYVGQQPDTILGDLGSKWFPAYKENGLFEQYRDSFLNQRASRFEFHYDSDGIDVWLDIQCRPHGAGILITFTDYTPVKKLQLQLEKMVSELSRSNEHLEEFAYAASHDLQEPLRKIHFFSNHLKERYQEALGAEGASLLERMENATKRMRRLIDDLLAFSRVSARRAQWESVDLNAVLQEVLADLETRIMETSARLVQEPLPVLQGDRSQLRQLLQNLLGNALKYTRSGVRPDISITCSTVPASSIEAVWQHKKPVPYYQIEVRDNGLGFDPEHSEKIFQLFHRLHGRSEFEGTGIGLAIVQKVADNHKGFVKAEGRPGEGATFTVYLPKE